MAKESVDYREPFEVMRHHEVFGHAHAAMELHRILTNEPAGFPNEIFQPMQVT